MIRTFGITERLCDFLNALTSVTAAIDGVSVLSLPQFLSKLCRIPGIQNLGFRLREAVRTPLIRRRKEDAQDDRQTCGEADADGRGQAR
jgi:hypothetical protein